MRAEDHVLALALYFMYCDFARPHKSMANLYPSRLLKKGNPEGLAPFTLRL